jgi:hypothetical protein
MHNVFAIFCDFYWSAFQDEYDRFYKNFVDDSSRTIHALKQLSVLWGFNLEKHE